MTKYLVQTATDRQGWTTRREHDSLERAQWSARSYDRCGGWVRLITSDGELVEGRATLPPQRRADASAS